MPSRRIDARFTALIIACAMFMEQLDGTVIATALPAMSVSLNTSAVHLSLGITAYLISLAVFIPVSGWIADRFGARTVFRAAIIVFTLGSMLCAASFDLAELTIARGIQGLGGAMMVPVGRLVLLRTVAKTELVGALAYLTVPALIGPVLGPPLGGFITTYASWRWIFFINLPIGALGIFLVTRFIENTREPKVHPLDIPGFVLSAVGLASAILGLNLLGRSDFGPADASLLVIGLVFGAAAIWHSLSSLHPLLDLSLLRLATFRISVTGGALERLGVGAIPFLLPLMLQLGFGMSAFASGTLTAATAAGAVLMKAAATPILRRVGFRTVFLGSAVLTFVTVAACALFSAATPGWLILAVLLVMGFSRSLQFTGLNAIAYADVPAARMSAATSLYSMLQQLPIGLGVALAALSLHLAGAIRGAGNNPPLAADFKLPFLLIGVAGLAATLVYRRLATDAGAEMSGHRARLRAAPTAAAE